MPTPVAFSTHRQLRHLVAEQLRAAILHGELKAGEWLRQERLAQEYGVSQMPVREALKDLAAEGLVEHVPYRGVRVVAFTPYDIQDLYAQRAFLESRAAYAAAQYITAAEIGELRRLHEAMVRHMAPEDVLEYRTLNREFHQLIVAASRRSYLIRSLAQIWAAFPSMLWGNFVSIARQPVLEVTMNDPEEHAALIDALSRRDSDAAAEIMRAHIEGVGQQLIRVVGSQPVHDTE